MDKFIETLRKENPMSKNKENVNPMKPAPKAPETEDEKIIFESEDVAAIAAEMAEEHGFDLNAIVGTGEGNAITLDDVQKAIDVNKEQTNDFVSQKDPALEDKIDFASDEAGEFAIELADKINIKTIKAIKGTGKDGAITKGDLRKALKIVEDEEKAKAAEEEAKNKPEESDDNGVEDVEAELDLTNPKDVSKLNLQIIEEIVSFGSPVRGALNTKPKVQESWNTLISKVVKLKKAIAAFEK